MADVVADDLPALGVTGGGSKTFNCVDKATDVTDSTTLFCGVVDRDGNDNSLSYILFDDEGCITDGSAASFWDTMGCPGSW